MDRSDYVIKKILLAVATMIVVIVFNFFLFRVLPGDPVKGLIHSPRMTQETQQRIRQQFGLDKPVWLNTEALKQGDLAKALDTQFIAYINNLFHGNLGVSFANRSPVQEILAERIWRTVILLFFGQLIAIIIGILMGIVASWRRGSKLDTSILLWGLFTWSLPTFFFGIILLILAQGRLPSGMMVTPGLKPEDGMKYWLDLSRHLVLPTITLAILYTGEYLLIMRSSIIEVLSEDFIFTAKAKGLSTFQILRDHALKNAMLPMITLIALTLGFTVGGAIQVETVFSWPGVGRLMYDSVSKQDFPMLQGIFLLLAASVILANLLADLLYSVLDPRVKPD